MCLALKEESLKSELTLNLSWCSYGLRPEPQQPHKDNYKIRLLPSERHSENLSIPVQKHTEELAYLFIFGRLVYCNLVRIKHQRAAARPH